MCIPNPRFVSETRTEKQLSVTSTFSMSLPMSLPLRGRVIADTCATVGSYAHRNQEKPSTPS